MKHEWRQVLRNILRNTAASTIQTWCREAGISGRCTKVLVAYAQGVSAVELSSLCGYTPRSVSRYRLRGLKQLRSYLAMHSSECPLFAQYLSDLRQSDGGPAPVYAHEHGSTPSLVSGTIQSLRRIFAF